MLLSLALAMAAFGAPLERSDESLRARRYWRTEVIEGQPPYVRWRNRRGRNLVWQWPDGTVAKWQRVTDGVLERHIYDLSGWPVVDAGFKNDALVSLSSLGRKLSVADWRRQNFYHYQWWTPGEVTVGDEEVTLDVPGLRLRWWQTTGVQVAPLLERSALSVQGWIEDSHTVFTGSEEVGTRTLLFLPDTGWVWVFVVERAGEQLWFSATSPTLEGLGPAQAILSLMEKET